ncbi:hypothetical protein OD632_004797 [Salmonella enterica]|nr:hypothetical protein [Salmonella enterica]
MKLRIFIPLLILSSCVFYINGYISLVCFLVSCILFNKCINFIGGIYSLILVLSGVLAFSPLLFKFNGFTDRGSESVYTTAIYQILQTNINDCDRLTGDEYGKFIIMKRNIVSYCGIQPEIDTSYFYSGLFMAAYSVLYNEFSLVSAFIPVPRRNNQCLGAVDQFLTMCPERRVYLDQRSLHALHDFERKQ